jgi:hypothetical protein
MSWYDELSRGWGQVTDTAQDLWVDHMGPRPEAPTTAPGTGGGGRDPLSMLPRDENGRPIPVTHDTLPQFIQQRWLESMNAGVSPEVAAAAAAHGATANTYRGGSQAAGVMTDFYGVPVTLPEGVTPEQLLTMMRDNPNGVGGGPGQDQFGAMVNFPAAGPGGRKVGDNIDLDIAGPDNGLVIYNDTDVSDGEISVNTGVNDSAGVHPVSGQRAWGFVPYGDGQFMFYTAGSDSHNNAMTDMAGAGSQHQTWLAMSQALQEQARAMGGSADDIVFDRQRQDTALMNRDPGTLTMADIRQDDHLESDERGQQILNNWRGGVQGTDTQIDDYLLMAGETAGDGLGIGGRYLGNGLDWIGEQTGLYDMGNPNWQFSAGDVVNTGEQVVNWVGENASSAVASVSDTVGGWGSSIASGAEDLFSW